MTLDDFFRANYRRMVGYCSSFGYNEADVEEVAADVIYRRFDEYLAKIELDGPAKYEAARRWMNRRILLDLGSRYKHLDPLAKPAPVPDAVHLDDPEAIVSLYERLPSVHPLLIDYEPCRKGATRNVAAGARQTANTSADKTRFCRERKKLLEALAA